MATRVGPLTTDEAERYATTKSNGALADYDYSNFYYSSSEDLFAIFDPYDEWWYGHARGNGYYLFSQPMSTPPAPSIQLEEQLRHQHLRLLNLASYNYLGLSYRPEVIAAAKGRPRPLRPGSGRITDPERDHEHPPGARAGTRPVQAKGSGDDLPDRLQHQRRTDRRADASRRPHHHGPERPRQHRGWRDPVQGQRAVLPAQPARGARPQAAGHQRASGWSSSRASTPWTATWRGCPRSSRWPDARRTRHDRRGALRRSSTAPDGRGVVEHFGLEDEIDIHIGTLLQGAGRHGRMHCRIPESVQLPDGFRAVSGLLVRPLPGRHRRSAPGTADRAARTRAAEAALVERGVHAAPPRRGRRRRGRVHLADYPGHDPQRPPDLPASRRRCSAPACTSSRSSIPPWPSTVHASASPFPPRIPKRSSPKAPASWSDVLARRGRAVSAGGSGIVQYHFRHAIGGFFEFPTANARRILPRIFSPWSPIMGRACSR